MLKQRIITIVVAAPCFVWLVLYSTHMVFSCAMLLLLLPAAYEWARLSALGAGAAACYSLFCGGLMALAVFFPVAESFRPWIYGVTLCWWLAAAAWLVAYQRTRFTVRSRALKLLMGLLTLLPPWYALTALHEASGFGPEWVLFLFLLVWAADIGAYIAGKLFGRIRLASAISPGKTLEGLAGGLVGAALVAGLASVHFKETPFVALLLLGVTTAALSVIGDLLESLMKRMANVKDSGSLLPGHGGMLDRIDSMTIAAPLFGFGCFYWIA